MKEKIYTYNEINYKLVTDYKDAFDNEQVLAKATDYFNEYDYIVGDWSYGSLRLKGFCKKENSTCSQYRLSIRPPSRLLPSLDG